MSRLPWLSDDALDFPPIKHALTDPDGLLAVGGDLSPARLLSAYSQGIFPWYQDDQPILWWSPSTRMVLKPETLIISRSMCKFLRKECFRVTLDTCFAEVIRQCAATRIATAGTWITEDMQKAYVRLHKMGHAHSVEVWQENQLVGGLYGISMGSMFFGESMFSLATNASKTGFIYLVRQLQTWNYQLIDCQVASTHLRSLGAYEMSRSQFLEVLEAYRQPDKPGLWQMELSFQDD
jgi:leucyl/phenylalanyl-tRNA--protein transferase